MAPRRGRKAAATKTAEPVTVSTETAPNDEPEINKPIQDDAKKLKEAKNVKDELGDANDEVAAAPAKNDAKSKKVKKNTKQTDLNVQNGTNSTEKIAAPPKATATAKKPTAKKAEMQAEQAEQEVDVDSENGNGEPVNGAAEESKMRRGQAKAKKEEPTKAPPRKVAKGKFNKAESEPAADLDEPVDEVAVEPAPSKLNKTSTKSKAKAKNDDAQNEDVEEAAPKSKRAKKEKPSETVAKKDAVPDENVEEAPSRPKRAKKVPVPKQPVEAAKPAKSKAKKVIEKKSTAKATTSKQKQAQLFEESDNIEAHNSEEDNVDNASKGRKRQPAKSVQSPAKKAKTTVVDGTAIATNSPEQKANAAPTKRRKVEDKAAADSTTTNESSDDLVTKRKKVAKADNKSGSPKGKMNPTSTNLSQIDFETDKNFNLKIVSWNVAGLRSLVQKNGFDYFESEKPDIICLQEIKCLEEDVPDAAKLKGYHPYWCSTAGGRGGVAILSKIMPYSVEPNLGNEEMDEEGRIITAEYSKFFLVCVYVPNAGRKLVNLDRRLRWNKLFQEHVAILKEKKPVVICGDMNVAHEEIDLANPKTNTKSAGFSKEEREGMTDLLELGFVDTFRDLYPTKEKAYSFWTYMGGARQKNVGWRLDYSIVSENLKEKVVDSFMRSQILGSDHCPIVLLLNI